MKILGLTLLAFAIGSCASNSTSAPTTPSEFTATTTDFSNYTTWTQNGTPRRGVDPAGLLGMGAHGGNDSMVTRTIWMKQINPERNASGQFPVGTIFLKESSMQGSVPMVTAMSKRGGSYNASGNGWEYFMLSGGQIMGRGDTLMGGMCKGCHTSAGTGKDFVFTR
ncbi:MAG: cytochrome P460 family protein [Candidatus Kapaibacterium sp.]|jgi:hypothetical protein